MTGQSYGIALLVGNENGKALPVGFFKFLMVEKAGFP